jgi:hypothetical protein
MGDELERDRVRAAGWRWYGACGLIETATAYADKSYVMLMDEHASAEAIAVYLLDIATRYMGLPHIPDLADRSDRVARTLVATRPNFETHWHLSAFPPSDRCGLWRIITQLRCSRYAYALLSRIHRRSTSRRGNTSAVTEILGP